MRQGAILVILLLVGLSSASCGRAKSEAVASADRISVDAAAVAARLAEAIRYETISTQDPDDFDPAPFMDLHAFLRREFDSTFGTLKVERVKEHSLLLTWKGSDESAAPILLMAHQDVVPAEPGSLGQWTHPPFSGEIADGFIWGRGALDDKANLLGLLEAVEGLLDEGYQPERTIYFAFGHDEEVHGGGAVAIAALLADRGVRLDFTLDEGMVIVDGAIMGIDSPIALIGTAEKGYLTLELSIEATGGHSSQPPARTAVGALSRAVGRLEAHQMPARLTGPAREMIKALAPHMGGVLGFVSRNVWLFGTLVRLQFEGAAATNAMVRTTTAPTMFNAGLKENVLPTKASAIVNFRVHPKDSIEAVVAHVIKTIDNPEIHVVPLPGASQPSAVSDTKSDSYSVLARTIGEIFPGAVVAPALVVAATDSRHFAGVSENTYRFSPARLGDDDVARIHGLNERISIENYAEFPVFFRQLILNASRAERSD